MTDANATIDDVERKLRDLGAGRPRLPLIEAKLDLTQERHTRALILQGMVDWMLHVRQGVRFGSEDIRRLDLAWESVLGVTLSNSEP